MAAAAAEPASAAASAAAASSAVAQQWQQRSKTIQAFGFEPSNLYIRKERDAAILMV